MMRKTFLIASLIILCLAFLALLPFSYEPFTATRLALLTLPTGGRAYDNNTIYSSFFLTREFLPSLAIILLDFALGIGIFKLVKMLQNESTKLNPKSVAATALAFFGIVCLFVPGPVAVVVIVMGMTTSLNFNFNTEWSLSNGYVMLSYIFFAAFGPSILMLLTSLQYWKSRMRLELRPIVSVLVALCGVIWLLLSLILIVPGLISLPTKLPHNLSTAEWIAFLIQTTIYVLITLGTPIGLLAYAYHFFRFKTKAERARQAEIDAVYQLED